MEKNQIQAIEGYFRTENEHWNGYAFEMLCAALKQPLFENPETPLQLFSTGIDIFTEQYETPLRAVNSFALEVDKQTASLDQKLFVYDWVCKYVRVSVFEKGDTAELIELLKSERERLKNSIPEPNKPLVKSLRETLKTMIQQELETLPETLKGLEPAQRLNILCKFLPYALPKVESVHYLRDEPKQDEDNKGIMW
jgi:hypothetical protein